MAAKKDPFRTNARWLVFFLASSVALIVGINTMCDVLLYVGAASFTVALPGLMCRLYWSVGYGPDYKDKEEEDKAKP